MPVVSSTSGIFDKSPQWGNCTGQVNADELIHGDVNNNNLTSHVPMLTDWQKGLQLHPRSQRVLFHHFVDEHSGCFWWLTQLGNTDTRLRSVPSTLNDQHPNTHMTDSRHRTDRCVSPNLHAKRLYKIIMQSCVRQKHALIVTKTLLWKHNLRNMNCYLSCVCVLFAGGGGSVPYHEQVKTFIIYNEWKEHGAEPALPYSNCQVSLYKHF